MEIDKTKVQALIEKFRATQTIDDALSVPWIARDILAALFELTRPQEPQPRTTVDEHFPNLEMWRRGQSITIRNDQPLSAESLSLQSTPTSNFVVTRSGISPSTITMDELIKYKQDEVVKYMMRKEALDKRLEQESTDEKPTDVMSEVRRMCK